jgi:hypothetical protein
MMFWQRSFEGEVIIDHRASPGLPEHVARAAGYDPDLCKEGKVLEGATLTCSHCRQRLIKNPKRERERATCLLCRNHYICDLCDAARRAPDYVHRPYEAYVEEVITWQSVSSPQTSTTPPLPPLVLR